MGALAPPSNVSARRHRRHADVYPACLWPDRHPALDPATHGRLGGAQPDRGARAAADPVRLRPGRLAALAAALDSTHRPSAALTTPPLARDAWAAWVCVKERGACSLARI